MKRIFCITLALVVMLSAFMLTANAGEVTETHCIYFQVPTAENVKWKNFSRVFCHIWREGEEGGDFYAWQAKAERCTDLGNGYWSYDISGFEFEEDGVYCVIFSNENGMQTYNLTLTSACKGDIVVCSGDTCTNPVDSVKTCTVARWLENGDTVFPVAQVGSDGTMVDPDGVSSKDIDRSWGNSDGQQVAMPKVEIEEETQAKQQEETVSVDTNSVEEGSLSTTVWLILGGAVVVVLLAAVVVVVCVKKKKNSTD